MSKHTFAAYGLFAAPRYRPMERLAVDDLAGTGLSLISLVHGFLKDLEAAPFRSDKSKEYLSVQDVDPQGCRVRFSTEFGKFGVEGDIKNTQSHKTTHTYGTDESAVVGVRNLLLSPPRSKMALFLTERYGGKGSASFFLRQLEVTVQVA